MFQQVPLVEIDGMKLIQTKAILNYIAEKYNLHGKDLKDRVMYAHFFYAVFWLYHVILVGERVTVCDGAFSLRINMYSEGLMDLMEMIMLLPFTKDPKPKLDNIQAKATERYLPVFEKVSVCFLCEMVRSNNWFILFTNL